MERYETKKMVFSKSDLPKDIKVGDVRRFPGGHYIIKDLSYTNSYGTFVLCDYRYDAEERRRLDEQWDIKKGVVPQEGNRFEVLHLISDPYDLGMGTTLGYVVRDCSNGEVKGISYKHLWELVFYQGAVNAIATVSQYGNMKSYLIDTIEELPSFNSSYWQCSIFEKGKMRFPLSEEVEGQMKSALKRGIKQRIEAKIKQMNSTVCAGDQEINQVASLIRKAKRITVLTGAGVSTMSGIPDYRSAVEGVWQKKPDLLESLNQLTFLTDPERFWDSYYDLFAVTLAEIIPDQTSEAVMTALDVIQPNEGHRFFAWLEEEGKVVAILSQNIDGLHQKAGSSLVVEMHGSVTTCSCPSCGVGYPLSEVFEVGTVPTCKKCGMVLRPDVVFFGDQVEKFDTAKELITTSDLIIVAGTSLQVAPFNTLPELAAAEDMPIVYINGELNENVLKFDYALEGNISEICKILKTIY